MAAGRAIAADLLVLEDLVDHPVEVGDDQLRALGMIKAPITPGITSDTIEPPMPNRRSMPVRNRTPSSEPACREDADHGGGMGPIAGIDDRQERDGEARG